jgi:integrase
LNSRDHSPPELALAELGVIQAELATNGLPEELHELCNWATNVGVESSLFLVLDASGCTSHPKYIGTVLAYLKQASTKTNIKNWQHDLPFLEELVSLIDSCLSSPFIFEKYPAMPVARSVIAEMKGRDLLNLPLIALIARPIQDLPPKDKEWIENLRDWCFIHFLNAIYSETEPNPYLIDVTNKLRLGVDKDPDWLHLFTLLNGPSSSFHELTRHLAAKANYLQNDTTQPMKRPSHTKLLETLHNFCQGKAPNTGVNSVHSLDRSLFRRYIDLPAIHRRPTYQRLSVFPKHEVQDNLDAENLGIESFDVDDSDEEVAHVVGVDDGDTPASQEIKVRQVLLSSIEDYQFLPFSWNRPSQYERQSLGAWLDQAWSNQDLAKTKMATLLFAAIQTGNSLRTALAIPLKNVSTEDWSIDIEGGYLHRRPPRRHAGWRSTPITDAWVEPRVAQLRIAFPAAAAATLARLHQKSPKATSLMELWLAERPPEQQFHQICSSIPALQRVTSGMLAYWLEQSSYEKTADPVLSQLLASRSISGLPGSCAYSSYTLGKVRSAIEVIVAAPTLIDSGHDNLNAAGSELCPIESLIREACADALKSVNALAVDPQQWPGHHNALTAYCVLVLLAAVGGRPITSPHESIRHFDFRSLHIYIEDKVSSGLTQGRLLPLPEFTAELIKRHYLPHLERLAQLIGACDPAMSKEIALLASGQPSRKLPLFFLLNTNPKLAWFEVSEKTLSGLNLFKWPLPWNLMRHRFPTQLKRMGADHEVVNGLTGHAEQGTSAYGPYSARVWQDDATEVKDLLCALLSRLDLKFPLKPNWPISHASNVLPASTASAISEKDIFGLEARFKHRQQSRSNTIQQATLEITLFVDGRPLDSLSSDDWEMLSRAMLLKEKNREDQTKTLPHHDGSLRYDTLRHWITRNWQEQGKRPRIKKRYFPLLEEASLFTAASICAHARLEIVLSTLRTSFESRLARAPSRREALVMGLVLLMAESRVADMTVINDVLRRQHFRIQSFNEAYFLEHAPSLDRHPSSPVRRYKISEMTAALLVTARSGSYKLTIEKLSLPPSLRPLVDILGLDTNSDISALGFVQKLAITVNQANAQQFPGFVSAYLNGQIVSVGLRHLDWIRVQTGYAVELPKHEVRALDDESDTTSEEDIDASDLPQVDASTYAFMARELVTTGKIRPAQAAAGPVKGRKKKLNNPEPVQAATTKLLTSEQAQKQSHDFFHALRDELNTYEKEKSSPRRDLDKALRRVIRHSPQVSRSCRLLGEWIRSLIWRKHKGKLLAISSLSRYLNALSVCFEAVACEHDLLDCDGDQVTAFYQEVMEARLAIRPNSPGAGEASDTSQTKGQPSLSDAPQSEPEEPPETYKTRRLALQLLRDFHRLMSRFIALEDPDWSEIDAGDDILSISPGVLLEKEYHYALSLAAPNPASASREDLARAFILLVGMRFGLRGAEITGLRRTDWLDADNGAIVVLVRKNKYRDLKTPAARRQVPLLFKLTDLEQQIIQRFFGLWEGISGNDLSIPLFVSSTDSDSMLDEKLLRYQCSQFIKQATRNPDLSLHHTRHTFANNVGLMLLQGTEVIWPHLSSEAVTTIWSSHVRQLLLCTDAVSRRSLWALARLLGHAHPHTTVRSYLHFLPELSDQYVWKQSAPIPKNWPTPFAVASQLHGLTPEPGYLDPSTIHMAPPHMPVPSLQASLRFLYLFQNGTPLQRASFNLAIDPVYAKALVEVVQLVDTILARRPQINAHKAGASTLLSHIRPARWNLFIARAGSIHPPENPSFTASEPLESILKMIGPSRQILLYREFNFKMFRKFVDIWTLPDTSFSIISQHKPHHRLQEWAASSAFFIEEYTSSQHRKTLQIDVVEDGDPPALQKYRCVVLPISSNGSLIQDSYELVLLISVTIGWLKHIESKSGFGTGTGTGTGNLMIDSKT